MATKTNKIEDFKITKIGRKTYEVTYTSPTTGKSWTQTTDDHDLIQNILNGHSVIIGLRKLKFICKIN